MSWCLVGSEMCIRDRGSTVLKSHVGALREGMAVKYTAASANAPAASAPFVSASNAN
jgi:hypothetical protein